MDIEGEVAAATLAAGGVMDINSAIQEVLKNALISEGLSVGIRQVVKALDKRQALLCVLANDCDEPGYVKIVEALCQDHQIRLLKVDSNKKLGEWAGLCKFDKEGKARKVCRCSSAVITDYGEKSQAHDIIEDYFKNKVH